MSTKCKNITVQYEQLKKHQRWCDMYIQQKNVEQYFQRWWDSRYRCKSKCSPHNKKQNKNLKGGEEPSERGAGGCRISWSGYPPLPPPIPQTRLSWEWGVGLRAHTPSRSPDKVYPTLPPPLTESQTPVKNITIHRNTYAVGNKKTFCVYCRK